MEKKKQTIKRTEYKQKSNNYFSKCNNSLIFYLSQYYTMILWSLTKKTTKTNGSVEFFIFVKQIFSQTGETLFENHQDEDDESTDKKRKGSDLRKRMNDQFSFLVQLTERTFGEKIRRRKMSKGSMTSKQRPIHVGSMMNADGDENSFEDIFFGYDCYEGFREFLVTNKIKRRSEILLRRGELTEVMIPISVIVKCGRAFTEIVFPCFAQMSDDQSQFFYMNSMGIENRMEEMDCQFNQSNDAQNDVCETSYLNYQTVVTDDFKHCD